MKNIFIAEGCTLFCLHKLAASNANYNRTLMEIVTTKHEFLGHKINLNFPDHNNMKYS